MRLFGVLKVIVKIPASRKKAAGRLIMKRRDSISVGLSRRGKVRGGGDAHRGRSSCKVWRRAAAIPKGQSGKLRRLNSGGAKLKWRVYLIDTLVGVFMCRSMLWHLPTNGTFFFFFKIQETTSHHTTWSRSLKQVWKKTTSCCTERRRGERVFAQQEKKGESQLGRCVVDLSYLTEIHL